MERDVPLALARGFGWLAAMLAAPVVAGAEVPNAIQVQGRLLDAGGAPQVAPVTLGIALFTVPSGGVALYEETHSAVAPEAGLFEVAIGTGSSPVGSFDEDTFGGADVYLELSVDGEPLDPRVPFRSAAFAFQARNAERADDAASVQGNDVFVNDISAEFGLSGGGSGAVSIAADPSEVQLRVTSSCPAGFAISEIDESGDVNCQAVGASVVAGTGLTASGGDPLVIGIDPDVTQRRVDAGCQQGAAMRSIDVDGNTVCELMSVGNITQIVAGDGLEGGGASGTVDVALRAVFYPPGGPVSTTASSTISTSPNTHEACVLSYTAGGANCLISGFTGSTWMLTTASRTGVVASCRMTCF